MIKLYVITKSHDSLKGMPFKDWRFYTKASKTAKNISKILKIMRFNLYFTHIW